MERIGFGQGLRVFRPRGNFLGFHGKQQRLPVRTDDSGDGCADASVEAAGADVSAAAEDSCEGWSVVPATEQASSPNDKAAIKTTINILFILFLLNFYSLPLSASLFFHFSKKIQTYALHFILHVLGHGFIQHHRRQYHAGGEHLYLVPGAEAGKVTISGLIPLSPILGTAVPCPAANSAPAKAESAPLKTKARISFWSLLMPASQAVSAFPPTI
jgi:hypothetical protein